MKNKLGYFIGFVVTAMLAFACAMANAGVDETVAIAEVVKDGVAVATPFLPVWAQVTLASIATLTTIIRPHIKPDWWAKLGGLGSFIDAVLLGNRNHTKNK